MIVARGGSVVFEITISLAVGFGKVAEGSVRGSVGGSVDLEVCMVVAIEESVVFEIIISPAVGFGKVAVGSVGGFVGGSVALDVCLVVASKGSIASEIINSPAVGFGKVAEGPVGLCWGRGPLEKKNRGSCQTWKSFRFGLVQSMSATVTGGYSILSYWNHFETNFYQL